MADKIGLFLRVDRDFKDALAVAAAADDRPVSSLIIRVMKEWMARNGHSLDAKPPKRPGKTPTRAAAPP